MAIVVYTSRPNYLLHSISKAIKGRKIETWELNASGYLTHKSSSLQWYKEAWFRPTVAAGMLIFGLVGPKNKKMSKAVYGVYHGRFIEMLLTHFDDQFSGVNATAQIVSKIDIF
jgi:hypothetical protein